MTHTLTQLRAALDWLERQPLTVPSDALAVSILAGVVADALDYYVDTAQRATDLSVSAGVASLGLTR